jgi:hypothetical protein
LKVSANSDSVAPAQSAGKARDNGRLNHEHKKRFYSFGLDDAVQDDHLVREIAAVLDRSWVYAELPPYYPKSRRDWLVAKQTLRDIHYDFEGTSAL